MIEDALINETNNMNLASANPNANISWTARGSEHDRKHEFNGGSQLDLDTRIMNWIRESGHWAQKR